MQNSDLYATRINDNDSFQDIVEERIMLTTLNKGVKYVVSETPEKESTFVATLLESKKDVEDRHKEAYTSFKLPNFVNKFRTKEMRTYSTDSQRWIGHVETITENSFTARLKDLTHGGTDESVEFELDEVPQEDKSLLQIGAAFYWNVGKTVLNGQSRRESFLRFQRLKPWDERDYDAVIDRAADLYNHLIIE